MLLAPPEMKRRRLRCLCMLVSRHGTRYLFSRVTLNGKLKNQSLARYSATRLYKLCSEYVFDPKSLVSSLTVSVVVGLIAYGGGKRIKSSNI